MKLPILYKQAKTGKTQIWTIEALDDYFQTVSGQLDGKKTISKPTHCKPKNIGKSNATTSQEQAVLEAQAKWQKKLEGGYHETIEDIEIKKFVEPMLARKYPEHKPTFPCLGQPKLDGIRCIATKDGLFTRRGKPIVSVPHIISALSKQFIKDPGLVLDGELYNHDLKADFNKITSLCRRSKPTDEDLAESKRIIQYHIYDSPSNTSEDYTTRACVYKKFIQVDNKHLKVVPTTTITSQEDLDAHQAECIEFGYEGQMIRQKGKYDFGRRSPSLIKRKEFLDEEFVIADITEGIGGRAGMMGRVVLNHNGSTFEAGARGNHDYFTELLVNKNEYVGKQATIRYPNLTPDGIPRFGIMVAIRDYE